MPGSRTLNPAEGAGPEEGDVNSAGHSGLEKVVLLCEAGFFSFARLFACLEKGEVE